MKLASFDIFDTTLVRKCGSPDNIFYLLSKRIYLEIRLCRIHSFSGVKKRNKRR